MDGSNGRQADWVELRDDANRYQGRINVRTLTLVLIGRNGDKVHELTRLIGQRGESSQGDLQTQGNMIS